LRHAVDVIEVRDATIDDADALATAHIDGWRAGYRGVVPDEYLDAEEFATSRRDRWRAWTWQAAMPESRMFVVSMHERVVGFGHAGPEHVDPARPAVPEPPENGGPENRGPESRGPENRGPENRGPENRGPENRGEVYGFYVHPSAWGTGAAPALMSRCEEFLRDEGFTSAVLWVLRDNPRALAFYEKAGWRFTGQESMFTPSDPANTQLPRIQYVVRQYAVTL
jgi:ribosomal protein S18 acetylase RimI-like enzyme